MSFGFAMSSIRICWWLCLLVICVAVSLAEAKDPTLAVAPPMNFTPGPDISFDRFFTIDTAQLAAPPGQFVGGDCKIPSSPLVKNGTVTVILPPTIDNNNTDSFETIHSQTLKVSLPYLFEQIGVDQKEIPKLVKRGIPLFEAAIKESLRHHPSRESSLARRSIFDDIVDFIDDVGKAVVGGVKGAAVGLGCSIFATGALPGYLAVAGLLHVQNINQTPRPTTPDQDFFVFPLHGAISHNDGISIFYNANLPPGFGDTIGVSIGRNIYLRQSANTRLLENAEFPRATRTVLHEFTHTKQYQAVGYNLARFGTQYLYNFCEVSSCFFHTYDNKFNPLFRREDSNTTTILWRRMHSRNRNS